MAMEPEVLRWKVAGEAGPWAIDLPGNSTVYDLECAVNEMEKTAIVIRLEMDGELCKVNPSSKLQTWGKDARFEAVPKEGGDAAPSAVHVLPTTSRVATAVAGGGGASEGASARRSGKASVVPASPPFSASSSSSSSSSAQSPSPSSAPSAPRTPSPTLPCAHCTLEAAQASPASIGSSAVAAAGGDTFSGGAVFSGKAKAKTEVTSDDEDEVAFVGSSCGEKAAACAASPPRKKARGHALPSQPDQGSSSSRVSFPGPSGAATTARSSLPPELSGAAAARKCCKLEDAKANVNRGVDAVAEAASNYLSNPSIPATKSLPPEASLSANPVPVAAIPAAVATVPQQPTSGASSAREGPEGASSDQQQSQAPRPMSANEAAAGAAAGAAAAAPGASSIAAGGAGNVRDDREQASPSDGRAVAAAAGVVETPVDGDSVADFPAPPIENGDGAGALAYDPVATISPRTRARTRAPSSSSSAREGEAKRTTRQGLRSLQAVADNPLSRVNCMAERWQCPHSLALTAAMLRCGSSKQRKDPEALLWELSSGDRQIYRYLSLRLISTATKIGRNQVDVDPRLLVEVCETEPILKKYVVGDHRDLYPNQVFHEFEALLVESGKRDKYKPRGCQLETWEMEDKSKFLRWPRSGA